MSSADAGGSREGPSTSPPPSGRSLGQAVATALVLLALIIVFNLLGPTAFFFLAAAVILISLYEILVAVAKSGRRPVVPLGMAGGTAALVAVWFEKPLILLVVMAVTLYAVLIAALRPGRGPTPASDAGWTMLAFAWVAGGGSGAVAILRIGEHPTLLLTAFILSTALSDIGGYFAGTYFGRHKMAPSISPSKSWEGYAGGFVAALAGGVFFGLIVPDLNPLTGLGLGLVAAAVGPVGDLVESLVKRELGIKDSGNILPGHGGLLDRIDAIVFTAPAAYLYLNSVL